MKAKVGVILGLVFIGLSLVFTIQAIGRPISEPASAVQPAPPIAPDAPTGNDFTLSWMSEEWDATYAVAWADYDSNRYLDLVVGNLGQPSRVYRNYGSWGGAPNLELEWTDPMTQSTYSVAWGDYDGDGWPDLAFGNQGYSRVYRNNRYSWEDNFLLAWTAPMTTNARSVAWGDYDGDGDLDLALGNEGSPNQLYRNDSTPYGEAVFTTTWTAPITESTQSIAWGDYDDDGDLDLAVGNAGQPNRLYRNDNGTLALAWTAPFTESTHSVAWGDYDDDGDLDLAVGNLGQPNRVYRNDNDGFTSVWVAPRTDTTRSIAWGDYEGDGDLDLAVGNEEHPNRVYRNDGVVGDIPALTLAWSASLVHDTRSLAWGDLDADGDLDLALGNPTQPNLVYLNNNEPGFTLLPSTFITNTIYAVAWGDYDRDNDLDLSVGHAGGHSLYRNDAGTLTLAWTDATAKDTRSVAWGDIDGDGDLDLAIGNSPVGASNWVYRNDSPTDGSGQAVFNRIWADPVGDPASSVIWGDYDGDGDLDLAVGGISSPIRLYRNDKGALTLAWTAPLTETTRSLAWGDADYDGDLDLAVGNAGQPNRIYTNHSVPGGATTFALAWSSNEWDNTWSVAWADYYNRDGKPELAVGNNGQPNRLYYNNTSQGKPLELWLDWSAPIVQDTRSVVWGDYDGDGDLDLAMGNHGGYNQVYRNNGGAFTLAWTAPITSQTYSVAWGDYDSDGDLDLLAGVTANTYGVYSKGGTGYPAQPNTPLKVSLTTIRHLRNANFSYNDARINTVTVPITYTLFDAEGDKVRQIHASYSFDGGGRWHTAYAASGTPTSGLTPRRYWKAADATPQPLAPNSVITAGVWLTPTTGGRATDVNVWVALSFPAGATLDLILQSPTGETVTLLDGQYFPSAISQTLRFDHVALKNVRMTGQWQLRVENHSSSVAGALHAWGVRVQDNAGNYVFYWNLLDNGFFGQSDNLLFRITAYPSAGGSPPNATPLYQQRLYATATSAPIRVRGIQVRVFKESTAPGNAVVNALIYRMPAGETTGAESLEWYTNNLGHLQGKRTIAEGDKLIALAPITQTDDYVLYYTNATPTATGVNISSINEPGKRTLIVSADNPLVLFNLDISLEWDARADTAFLAQLHFDLQRASELLYDATNGQAALGNLTLYHDKQQWDTAALQIHASNALIPNADVGGIVPREITRVVTVNPYALAGSLPYTLTYLPGAVRMGTVWGRYGEEGAVLGDDWPRALVHELGHYLFYLYDNYVGLDAAGALIPLSTCGNSMMSNAYEYNEYRNAANWGAECGVTLSARRNGRSDWETIAAFYPALATDVWAGPFVLPLKVTQISEKTSEKDYPLSMFIVSLTDAYGASLQPGPHAQAVLYQGKRVIDLGRPEINKVAARGARAGDRLCVYEFDAQPPRWGCEALAAGDTTLALVARTDWQPEIRVTPWTTATVVVTVTHVPAGLPLMGRVYPGNGQATAPQALAAAGDSYTATFTLPDPDTQATVYIWVNEAETETAPRREAVTSYAIGGSANRSKPCNTPPCRSAAGDCNTVEENFLPAISPDGQVLLYAPRSSSHGFYTLQQATRLPDPLPWTSVVGSGYYVLQSRLAPPLAEASINFRYRRQDVLPGEEAFLALYYRQDNTWVKLPTTRHPAYNEVTAPAQGSGLYVLMSSLEIQLPFAGWNLLSYPVQETRTVTDAMASIAGYYHMVYGYAPGDAADPWKVYAPSLVGSAMWVNDLHALQFGQGYWISATQPITWLLKGATDSRARQAPTLTLPPATYYGRVVAGPDFAPTAGMPVVASVAGRPCAQTTTRLVGNLLVYTLNVGYTPVSGACGAPGQPVTFTVNGQTMTATPLWQNDTVQEVTLSTGAGLEYLYLPLVMKQQ